jgi:hypothetical protein
MDGVKEEVGEREVRMVDLPVLQPVLEEIL